MQPYFFPYPGYYRLMVEADFFVVLDDVQFPRRGWVHRNKFSIGNNSDWFTLPVKKQPRESLILDTVFREDSHISIEKNLNRFDCFRFASSEILNLIKFKPQYIIDYLMKQLAWVHHVMGFNSNILKSSELEVNPLLKGQDKIIEISNILYATEYINLSGGKDLYCRKDFERRGLNLKFLRPYQGSKLSTLESILLYGLKKTKEMIVNEFTSDQITG